MIAQEQLDKINKDYYKHYPKDKGLKWSACNFYINQGNVENEPIGTAQSMHDCSGCKINANCEIKKDNPTWFYNDEVREYLEIKYKEMGI